MRPLCAGMFPTVRTTHLRSKQDLRPSTRKTQASLHRYEKPFEFYLESKFIYGMHSLKTFIAVLILCSLHIQSEHPLPGQEELHTAYRILYTICCILHTVGGRGENL